MFRLVMHVCVCFFFFFFSLSFMPPPQLWRILTKFHFCFFIQETFIFFFFCHLQIDVCILSLFACTHTHIYSKLFWLIVLFDWSEIKIKNFKRMDVTFRAVSFWFLPVADWHITFFSPFAGPKGDNSWIHSCRLEVIK